MAGFSRKIAFSVAALGLIMALGATPALAKTTAKHHAKTNLACHCAGRVARANKGKTVIRIAQQHLANLGYYNGKIDGIMGSGTKAAIKKFQHDKYLAADGVLGRQTNAALENADGRVLGSRALPTRTIGRHSMPLSLQNARNGTGMNPIEDAAVNPDYAASMSGRSKTLSSRFARVEVSETGSDSEKRYNVALNGQVIMLVEGQPSVIGVSPTYDLGNEDAIVFTSFSPDAAGCVYKTHVLTMTGAANQLLEIKNCTRDFQAQVTNGSLYLTFPESDDARAVGASWRIEGATAERL